MNTNCLDIEMLARYIEGDLYGAEKHQMETHLLECEACLEEFVMAKTILNETDFALYEPGPAEVVREVVGKVREKIRNLVKWVTEIQPPVWMYQYAASPVRSGNQSVNTGSESVFVKKKMGGLKAEIFIQKSAQDKVSLWIKVFKGRNDAKNVSLTLLKEGGRPLARFLNNRYEFFDKLGYGSYALVLEQHAQKKGDFLFQIDEKGFYEK